MARDSEVTPLLPMTSVGWRMRTTRWRRQQTDLVLPFWGAPGTYKNEIIAELERVNFLIEEAIT
jgi:hypothetical protein